MAGEQRLQKGGPPSTQEGSGHQGAKHSRPMAQGFLWGYCGRSLERRSHFSRLLLQRFSASPSASCPPRFCSTRSSPKHAKVGERGQLAEQASPLA
ncbi:hypothetical protein GOP47_0020110 [Adiantum capillus-veneris]|uniref:Uncharacterized protein n=1 Tax=Adiantum capillus-veneris TaxID=13818 RepID=A0A9D4UCT6_ADICA|nr:hypothetical protein GOP47_0020110 [Adiantum capillus-veneris]